MIKVFNPSNGQLVGEVPNLDASFVDIFVNKARNALKEWRFIENKSDFLLKYHDLISQNYESLAELITKENGKTISDSKKEVTYGMNFLKWFAFQKPLGSIMSNNTQQIICNYEPVGIVAAITPWNFPVAMILRKLAPAIAAGCPIIIKPSELTPLSAIFLEKISKDVGFPDGLINIITGDQISISERLCNHPEIKKLTFTGSTAVGRILYQKCAMGIKKVCLELGGNAPFIIFEDAQNAVDGVMKAKFRNSGQACTSINRCFIHKSIKSEIISKLKEEFAKLKVGDGFISDVGPLISIKSVEKIQRLIKDAISKGAKLVFGGANNGLFFTPTILENCNKNMEIFHEEIFGPILACYEFETEAEAVDLANSTSYGLASYFYTQDIQRILRVSEILDFGMVGINQPIISNEFGAFGGRKDSGFGVEGSHLGIFEYLNTKYINIKK